MIPDVLERLREHLPASGSGALPSASRIRVLHIGTLYRGRAVYVVFTGGRTPAYVVKVENRPERHLLLRREAQTLRHLERHRVLDDRVPRLVALLEQPRRLALVQTVVGGTLMSVRLRRRVISGAGSVERDHRMLRAWVEILSYLDGPAHAAIEPQSVAELVDRACAGSDVPWHAVSRFARTAERAGALTMPLVRLHGDLNTTNYLVGRGRIHVVDWEGGLSRATPLTELFTALLQYGQGIPATSRRLPTLLESVHRTFADDHWLRDLSDRTWTRSVAGLGLPTELADYLRVATLASIVSPPEGAGAGTDGEPQTWRRPGWTPVLHHVLTHRPGRP